MKKFIFFLFTLLSLHSSATHCMGGHITWKENSDGSFSVYMYFYRDCSGILAPLTPSLTVTSASCNNTFNVKTYRTSVKEIPNNCVYGETTCTTGSLLGEEEYIYEGRFFLPFKCTDWVISYELCCRNGAITDLNQPQVQYTYFYSILNNTVSPNNGVFFNSSPQPFGCVDKKLCYDASVTSPDGDSVIYELTSPMQNSSQNVNYIVPFNYRYPITSTVYFDSTSGYICFVPQYLENGVFAVKVTKYRNGNVIGVFQKDIQINIFACECTIALPIVMGNIKLTKVQDKVTISWTTYSELNNNYFKINKWDGSKFYMIGAVRGHGTTDSPHSYTYTDFCFETDCYMIEQVDYDGNSTYFSPLCVYCTPQESYNIWRYYNILGQEIK